MKEVTHFWPFMKADYRAAEAYLEAQSRKGLHICHIDNYGVRATYEKGEPKDIKYSIDYYSGEYEEKETYIKLLEDAGWNHVADMDMYMIFASEKEQNPVPIHTDWQEEYRLMRKGLWRYEIPLGIIAVAIAYFLLRDKTAMVTKEQWIAAFTLYGMVGFGLTGLLHSGIIYWKTAWALRRQSPMKTPDYVKAKTLGLTHVIFGLLLLLGWMLRLGLVIQDCIAEGNTGAIAFFAICIFSGLALYVVGRLPEDLLPKKVYLVLSIFLMLLTVVGFIGFMFVLSSDL